ncbi:LysR family transcriptional regulator [Roseivivax isoporae]|uniref:LysR family transcriptional regulator n=1 Tax=Roseivivax isoporae LMG 25204 TaxID=1449351 RepID=X7F4P5_9RHOB|nr:LysR family transcriptional regulator [Roseivivax isoporae]ETX27036.1 LysR family transcriptional regulator [Roseivivax isoporae LMG 25204]
MTRYRLADFDAVLAIARRGSFRAAALDVGMSTSALSSAVSKLEEQLGVRLFNRTTRSVSLTGAGQMFVDQVSPALRDIHQALDTARAEQETPSGTLRINTFATAGREILVPLVLEFLKRFPGVRIDLVTEGALTDIVADGFDFGVRSEHLVPSDMIAIPLGPARRHAVVATPAYFDTRDPPRVPSDLRAHPCIRTRLPNGALFRWPFDAEGQPVQVDVDGPITLDEASLARLAVLDGLGIGYFMEHDVRADIEAGRLVSVLEPWLPPLSPLCLYYPSRRNPPAAFKVFVDLARELARAARTR